MGLGDFISDVGNTISDGADAVGDVVSDGADAVGDAVSDGADAVADVATSAYDRGADAIETFGGGITNAIGGAFRDVLEGAHGPEDELIIAHPGQSSSCTSPDGQAAQCRATSRPASASQVISSTLIARRSDGT